MFNWLNSTNIIYQDIIYWVSIERIPRRSYTCKLADKLSINPTLNEVSYGIVSFESADVEYKY